MVRVPTELIGTEQVLEAWLANRMQSEVDNANYPAAETSIHRCKLACFAPIAVG